MYRIFLTLAFAGALSACSGSPGGGDGDNPLEDGTVCERDNPLEDCQDASDEDPDTDGDSQYGTGMNAELTMNNITYDESSDEVVLNNLPFDGDDNVYARNAGVDLGNGYGAYENAEGNEDYYAVFRRTDYSQVAAAGTNGYIGFGFGGVGAQRLSGAGSLPETEEAYLFTGEYAAVRTYLDPGSGSEIMYVTGDSQLRVDIEDFDNIGAVEGLVVNRRFFDDAGVELTELAGSDYISMATSEIDFDNWTINSSDAVAVQNGQPGPSGNWSGLFTGPNGEEVAGIVVLEGSGAYAVDETTGEYINADTRETGAFIAER